MARLRESLNRRRVLAALAAGGLLLAMLWLATGADERDAIAVSAARAGVGASLARGADTGRAAHGHLPARAVPAAPPAPDDGDGEVHPDAAPVALAALAAEDYRKRSRYPPWAHVLQDGEDPILRDRLVTPVSLGGPYGEEPLITVYPERTGFESPEPVLLYAYLEEEGRRVPAAKMQGRVLTEDGKVIAEIAYRDDGKEGDAVAGDGLYTAVLEPSPEMFEPLSASYLVKVVGVTEDGVERRVATSFLYSNPHAQLTGRFRDQLVDGELVVAAEVEVKEAGRFHLEGTLYTTEGDRSVAWAQNSAELTPGRHWIELHYPGLAFHEKGVDGPFELRFAALSTTTQMPNAKNRLYEHAHVTAPYAREQFSAEPYNDPDLLAAAEQLENELAAGQLEAEGTDLPAAAPALPGGAD